MTSQTKIALLLIAIFTIIAISVANCGGGSGKGVMPNLPDDNPGGNQDNFTPSNNLKEIDQLGCSMSDITGDTYTLSYTGTPCDIRPGDIISGSTNGGYLRKVTEVQDTGHSLIMKTVQATLDEAIEQGTISASVDYTRRGNAVTNQGTSFVVPLTGQVISTDANATAEIVTGEVSYAPRFDLNMQFEINKGLTVYECSSNGILDFLYDVKVTANSDVDLTGEKLVYSSAPRTIKIGPIYGNVIVDFYAGFDIDGKVSNSIIGGIDSTLTSTIGAEYHAPNWSPVVQFNTDFTPGTVAGNADGQVVLKGYIRPEAHISIGGLECAQINCLSDFNLSGTGQLSPACLVYDLTGDLSADVSINPAILGDVTPYTYELLNINEHVSDGSVGTCGDGNGDLLVNAVAGPDQIEGGGTVEYSVTASGDTGITFAWSCSPTGAGQFNDPYASATNFFAEQVNTDTPVEIKVVVKSDHNTTGISKTKAINIVKNTCPYQISEILGSLTMPENQMRFYSVRISNYSVHGVTYNWTCDPPTAGYFLTNNTNIAKFFANAVDADTSIRLLLEVDSTECPAVNREKQITIQDDGSTGN